MRRIIGATVVLVSLPIFTSSSFAKPVQIEWKKIGNAVSYELKLKPVKEPENQDVIPSESTVYSGNLVPGAYSYQIRGVDPSGQKGRWTGWKTLAVLPESPELKSPEKGEQLAIYNDRQDTHFSWSAPELAQEFSFTLFRDDRIYSKIYISTSAHQIENLPDGRYRWRVQSVLRNGSTTWESLAAEEREFSVVHKALEPPELVSPLGAQMPPENQKLSFEWNPVEGADGYELFVLRKSDIQRKPEDVNKQALSDELLKSRPAFVLINTGVFSVRREGSYVWAVRALSGTRVNESSQAKGSPSFGDFILDRNVFFNNDRSCAGLSFMASPYTYRFLSPTRGVAGYLSAVSLVLRMGGDNWISKQWGITWAVQYSRFTVFNQSFSQPELELGVKYRLKLDNRSKGFSFYPKLSLALKDYNLIVPVSPFYSNYSSFSALNIYTLGLSLGFDLKKQWSERFSMGFRAQVYLPIKLLGGDSSGGQINGGISKRNLGVGFQSFYWLGQKVGAGLGIFTELKSLSYFPATSSVQERIFMDATYFVGTILIRFSQNPSFDPTTSFEPKIHTAEIK